MKIKREVYTPETIDINELYVQFATQYDNVFICQIESHIFIYRALGRAEYKDIMQNSDFSDLDKEEMLCMQCLLYPDPNTFDWKTCDAGIPTELSKHILRYSYLDSFERRFILRDIYRLEMQELDNQITCLIHEAFPSFSLEEIESWDVQRTTKYLTRAEWKLKNFHHFNFEETELPADPKPLEAVEDGLINNEHPLVTPGVHIKPKEDMTQEKIDTANAEHEQKEEKKKTIRGGNKTKKLTPDNVEAYKQFLQNHPEFADKGESVFSEGIEGLAQDNIDTLPPALRPGF